jgi:hypothetical protein
MQWQFVPEERVLGPQIVRTTLRFSVEGFGEIEVYHLGYTNASTSSERAVGAVYLTVILYHWYH